MKYDNPVDILLDNTSSVDMSATFKDTKHSRDILRCGYYDRAGVEAK
jgi:hypothetical protein